MKATALAIVLFTMVVAQYTFAQEIEPQPIQSVTTAYMALKNALVSDNGDSTKAAAKVLYDTIDKLPMDKLSASQHSIWMKYNEKLSYDAEHMKSTNDIDHQREHFASLSKNMYKMLKELDDNSADLYYQYCPMAMGGKGAYWLSQDSVIHNPYLGKKMPHCGSTDKTLKAKQ